MPKELLDVVDAEDRPVGVKSLDECLSDGTLHRAVAVLLFDSRGRLLIQRRAPAKRWHPGLWTLSATGHVRSGETYEAAAAREAKEEVGAAVPLAYVTKFLSPTLSDEKTIENEWVGILDGEFDGEASPDGAEVDKVARVTLGGLRSMDARSMMTPDSMMVVERYLKAKRPQTA